MIKVHTSGNPEIRLSNRNHFHSTKKSSARCLRLLQCMLGTSKVVLMLYKGYGVHSPLYGRTHSLKCPFRFHHIHWHPIALPQKKEHILLPCFSHFDCMSERFPRKSVNENKIFMTDFVNKDNGWFRSTFLMQNSCGQPDLWREEGRTGYCPKSKVWKQTLLKCQGRMFWWERPQNKGNAISQNLKSGGAPRSHFLIWAFDSSTLRALWYIPLIISISGTS